jgi:hypothetical protein
MRVGQPGSQQTRTDEAGAATPAAEVHGHGHEGHVHGHDHLDGGEAPLARTLPGVGAEGGPAAVPDEIAHQVLSARLTQGTRAPQGTAPFGLLGGGGAPVAPPDAAEVRAQLTASGGFGQLGSTERAALDAAFKGTDAQSLRLQNMAGMVVRDPAFARATPERQARALKQVVENAQRPLSGGGMGALMGGAKPPPAPTVEQTLRTLRGTEGWAQLSSEDRGRIESRVRRPGAEGEGHRRMFSGRVQDPSFLLQDGKGQAEALTQARRLTALSRPMLDDKALKAQVEAAPGYQALSAAERRTLQDTLTKQDGFMARSNLHQVVQSPEWGRAGAQGQAAALRQALAPKPADAPPAPAALLRRRVEASPGWGSLTGAEQRELQERIAQPGDAGVAQRRSLTAALDNPRQLLRSPAEQGQGLRDYLSATHLAAGHDPTTPLPRDAAAQLSALPGYRSLDATTRERLDALVGGPTNGLSYRARTQLEATLADVRGDTAAVQAKELKRFLVEGSHLPQTGDLLADPGAARATRLSRPRQLGMRDFQGTTAAAASREIGVGEHTVTLIYPQAGVARGAQGNLPSAEDVATALGRLPPEQLAQVKTVTLSPVENRANDYWGKRYNIANFQSAATAGPDGHVTIYPSRWTPDSLSGVMRHELGHVLDPTLGAGGANRAQATAAWQAAQAKDLTYLSTYARASVAEDVAETFGIYTATRGTPAHDELRRLFPGRFAILDARSPD